MELDVGVSKLAYEIILEFLKTGLLRGTFKFSAVLGGNDWVTTDIVTLPNDKWVAL